MYPFFPVWNGIHHLPRQCEGMVVMIQRIGYVILILSPFIAFAYFLR